ncbi:hypothetical protein [Corynebacterium guangdongense]|uniref:META domain-containing protein n=1 Tax=Corynebacterium guangdongense TaxID=1783348 RepID=A0ABU1ZZA1_9CORY|nr:hypothetical protein [Corynebacterium guangdongense]MDR7330255.1 hypothetical protein [Corynebacterium guangdongense]WJZ18813.1 hypothetical protein CGUA_11385 [Corynebacterium guangdongense]
MRRPLVLLAAAIVLSACAPDPAPVEGSLIGQTWQVTDIYTTPEAPSTVSGSAAGAVQLVFGESSATGSTGCAPIQAEATFLAGRDPDSAPVPADEAEAVVFSDVGIPDPGEAGVACEGTRAWAHEHMTGLLTEGATFDIEAVSPAEMVLTLRGDVVDRPALRLATR